MLGYIENPKSEPARKICLSVSKKKKLQDFHFKRGKEEEEKKKKAQS